MWGWVSGVDVCRSYKIFGGMDDWVDGLPSVGFLRFARWTADQAKGLCSLVMASVQI
jgi:hypothetical protein